MVRHPAEYSWSSYHSNAQEKICSLVKPHETYNRLGSNIQERQQAYSALFKQQLDQFEEKKIKNAIEFSMPTGDSRFIAQIEQMLEKKLGHTKRGRPRKTRRYSQQ